MAVRSKVLFVSATMPTNQFTVAYTAPAGRTAIVKDLVVINTSDVARTVAVAVRRSGVDSRILRPGVIAVGTTLSERDRYWVLAPGDSLTIYNGGESASTQLAVYACGVELDGVAPA